MLEEGNSGWWESGKPAFAFSLFRPPSSPELWDVRISPGFVEISKGSWKRGRSIVVASSVLWIVETAKALRKRLQSPTTRSVEMTSHLSLADGAANSSVA